MSQTMSAKRSAKRSAERASVHGRQTATRAGRPARNLRRVLRFNAATSGAAGAAGLLSATSVSATLGLAGVGWIRLVSAGLVVFAVAVVLVAGRPPGSLRQFALAVSVADLAWVAGTAVVLATVDLATTGQVLAVVMAVGVADFALLQLWFRNRMG